MYAGPFYFGDRFREDENLKGCGEKFLGKGKPFYRKIGNAKDPCLNDYRG